MFIKSLIEDVSALIHRGKSYPVVNGIANVPKEVRDEVVSHTHWQDAVDAIDKKTLTALDKANKVAEKEAAAQKPEVDPPESNDKPDSK